MKREVQIIVDVHENNSGILQEIIDRGLEATEQHMDSSDVLLEYNGKTSGVELKRGQDFSNSTKEGRLKDQICRLYNNYDYPVLIVEAWKPWVGDEDTAESVSERVRVFNMAIRTLNRRICVYETENQSQTVDIIEEIARDMKAGKLFTMKRPVIVEPGLSNPMKVLCAFPQVSRQRAEDILLKYDSVRNALYHLSEWPDMKIGLTKKRCDEIREAWEESDG